MVFNIKNNIFWVGKIDWMLKKFHGNELSTHKGSTYNSYLIKEEKIALIDTVWQPFAQEFINNLSKEINLKKIDFIIANHAEIDHSGALPKIMEKIPDTPIYCTSNGVKSLKGHYHEDWNFQIVKTGDKLNLGNGKELIFIEAPMLHWPDSMFCYLTKDNVLFSNDSFGQHYASEYMFNDLVNQEELLTEAMKYYANILTPFSRFVLKKIKEFQDLNLPLEMICPSHGVIWRKKPLQIVEKYLKWADGYYENQISIIYDTMWNGTRVIAEQIAQGIKKADPKINIKIFNTSQRDKNDIILEIFKSKGVLVGSPTINRGVLTSIAGLLEEIKGLNFKGKKASAFGCYGWSGESVKIISESLNLSGFDIITEGLKILWNPNEESKIKCFEFGQKFGEKLKENE